MTGGAGPGFPTTNGAYDTSFGGDGLRTGDAFLSKFTSSGSLSWSTYLGGSNGDKGQGVTTDGSGNVYVTGRADTTFPTTNGAYQSSFGGNNDAFLSKFTSSGSLSWSTYLGGSNGDRGNGVTTDGSGNVYVTGGADTTFPTTSGAYQASFGGGDSRSLSNRDAFLSKFTTSGSLSWSTYLGGSGNESGSAVTTDGSGNVYVTGNAGGGFPTTSGAYQPSFGEGGDDAFLSKFNSGGSLSWSTYLGGGNSDGGSGVTTDGSGNVYVTGSAQSDFPTTSGAYQTSYGGVGRFPYDAFLTKFNFNSVGTGTDQLQSAAIGLKAYPNPASKTVTLSYELPAAQSQVTLVVVDEQGKVIIRKEQGRQPAGRHTHQLQALQEASPGTYFIRLKLGGDKQQVERVVKVE
jgi:hypothetical protein